MRGVLVGMLCTALLAGCTTGDGRSPTGSSTASPLPASPGVPSAPPSAEGLLAEPDLFLAPFKAERIVAGDLNGDGRTDLVLGRGRSASNTAVLLADPDGGLRARAGADGGAVMTLADLDDDGALDLAAGAPGGSVLALSRGLGNGTFAPSVRYPLLGSGLVEVAAADMDGDGDLDLTTVFGGSSDAAVLRGDGSGAFSPPVRSAALVEGVGSAAAADLTGDGAADLALIGYDSLSVVRNDGAGALTAGEKVSGEGVGYPAFLRSADLNADGNADLAYSSFGGVALRFGDGAGSFDELTLAQLPRSDGYRFALGDLNGDSAIDLVADNGSGNSVTVVLGDGRGGFGQRATTKFDSSVLDVAIADTNGDCAPDVVAGLFGDDGHRVAVLANTLELPCPAGAATPGPVTAGAFPTAPDLPQADLPGGSSFAPPVVTAAGGDYAPPELIDVNGDGHRDLVLQGGYQYRFTVRLGRADGAFGPPLRSPAPALTKPTQPPCNDTFAGSVAKGMSASGPSLPMSCVARVDVPIGLAVADIDGDGELDLVTGTADGGSVAVLRGDGTGRFGPQRRYPTGAGSAPSAVLTGDLDGDGSIDVLARTGVGTLRTGSVVLLNDGEGRLGRARAAKPRGVQALGDMDGDGDLDLAAVEQRYRHEARVTTWLNDGSARFTRSAVLLVSPKSQGETTLTAAVLRDADGDDVLDLLAVAPGSREVRVLRGAGDGSFTAPRSFDTGGSEPAAVESGDVTGDGLADLVVANQGSLEFAVLAADGSGGFASAVTFRSGGPGPFALFLADVDGDDALDVVVFHSDPRNVAVHVARLKRR